jgi:integrase
MKLDKIPGDANRNLFKHPVTGVIYFRQHSNNKEITRSTKTTMLSEARKKAHEFRQELFGTVRKTQGRKLVEDLFPEWINMKKSTKAPATITSIELSWSHLKPFIGGMLPEEITPVFWESEYIPKKRAKTHRNRKFMNDRKWLSMFLIHLNNEGLLNKVPRLINPDPETKAGKVYSEDEIHKLLINAGPDLLLQILMALTMGMRSSEILFLSWDRADLKNKIIHLRAEDTKVRKARSFAISEDVYNILKDRKRVGPWVFSSPEDKNKHVLKGGNKSAWATCKEKANVRGRFHDLRHTFLTRAFKACNSNPALICNYAGLSLEVAQKTYLHFTPEDTRSVLNPMSFTDSGRVKFGETGE